MTLGAVRLIRLAPVQTAGTAAGAVLAALAALLLPAVSSAAVDRILTGAAAGPVLAALAGLLAVRALAEVFGGRGRVAATSRVTAALRYRLLRQVFALGVPGTRRHATGDLVTRLTGNAAGAARAVPSVVDGLVAVGTSVGGLVALVLIDWRLGAVFLAGVLPAVLLLRLLMGRVTESYGEYLDRMAAIAARLTDALAGSATIRACGTTRREIDRVLAPLPELSRAGRRIWDVQRRTAWQVDLVLTGIRVAVLAVAGLGVAGGTLSPGEFLACALYLTFALGFLYQVDTLMYLADARANAGRVAAVLAEPPVVHSGRDALPPGPGALSVRDVALEPTLTGIDLEIPAGAAVALVGRSGAGKSTLAMLAGGLLEPDSGVLRLDGADIRGLDPTRLHRAVGFAFDRPVLLGETIRDALTYGRCGVSDQEIWRAAGLAQAGDFLRRLPDGLDTPLPELRCSGGELQRLGLARTIVHGGRIFLLDDAMSSVDTVTEARITEALTGALAGRTRLLIAHRAGTAARADLVAWLDDGRIRAVAPHRTLWEREPDYRAVFATGERGS